RFSCGRSVDTCAADVDAVTILSIGGAWPSALEFDVVMNAPPPSSPYASSNGFIIFDYQGPTNFKFAGGFLGVQQWVIGHRDANRSEERRVRKEGNTMR